MTNYVTGFLPAVTPKDWMKIAVGGVLGAVQLKDLKDFVGQSTGGNGSGNSANLIAVQDVTWDGLSAFSVGKESSVPLTITPIGATAPITVTYQDGDSGSVKNAKYDASTRLITATGVFNSSANFHVTWNGGQKDFQIPVQADNSGSNNNGGGGTETLHPDLVLNPSPQTMTVQDFEANGLKFTSREGGSYGYGTVTAISGMSLSDFAIDYNSNGDSVTTVKPTRTGLITSTQDVTITVKKDDEVRQLTFHVTAEAKNDVWSFSPDTASISATDFASQGLQTWARDNSGSGEVINWTSVENSDLSNFTIGANQTSSGQQTITLKDASTVSSGKILVFHAIGGGTEHTFTVTIT